MIIKRIYLTLLVLFCVFTFCTLLISSHSNIEIKSRLLLSTFIFLFLTSVILIIHEKRKTNISSSITLILVAFIFSWLIQNIHWGGEWKTQTILLEHLHDNNRRIEFQIADQGIFGYSERTVEVKTYSFIFEYIKDISEEKLDLSEWKKVDIFVNEAELKGG